MIGLKGKLKSQDIWPWDVQLTYYGIIADSLEFSLSEYPQISLSASLLNWYTT